MNNKHGEEKYILGDFENCVSLILFWIRNQSWEL